MRKILVILILVIMLCGCKSNSSNNDIEKIMKENEYVIIDVRTKEEYDKEHIKDAINISYDEINDSNLDKNKVIFVYCMSGNRSKMAYDILTSLGYKVYDLGAISDIDLPKE